MDSRTRLIGNDYETIQKQIDEKKRIKEREMELEKLERELNEGYSIY